MHAKTSAKLGIPLLKLVYPPAINFFYLLHDDVKVVHSAGLQGDGSSPSAMKAKMWRKLAALLLQALLKTHPELEKLGLCFSGEHYSMPLLLQLMRAYVLQLVQTSRRSRGLARPEPAIS